jgi:hypothetical protein
MRRSLATLHNCDTVAQKVVAWDVSDDVGETFTQLLTPICNGVVDPVDLR